MIPGGRDAREEDEARHSHDRLEERRQVLEKIKVTDSAATKVLRYCGGFLNAMDEADEGAPVFAKVKLIFLMILQIGASYVAKDHNNNWSSGNGDVELLMTLKVRSNMFWVQLVTGRRGKAANKKSYFDQVDPLKKVDPLNMEDGTNRNVESGGSGLLCKYA